jgi:prepilin-type N-terminal cleavage/methylation domain-containing protein
MTRYRSTAGVTLIEVLIAVTLLSLLTVGMSMAMRVGFNTFSKTDGKLMDNRRVAGAQRILEQELEGIMPVNLPCLGGGETTVGLSFVMFQGQPQVMRLVSTFSLQQAWRGQPQVLEFFVVPGEEGRGVRLVVNELPYHPVDAGRLCMGQDPTNGLIRFPQPQANERSFVLADKLAYCRFVYLQHPLAEASALPLWAPTLAYQGWPQAVRIEMAPLEPDAARLQPISVTAPLRMYRAPDIPYGDF